MKNRDLAGLAACCLLTAAVPWARAGTEGGPSALRQLGGERLESQVRSFSGPRGGGEAPGKAAAAQAGDDRIAMTGSWGRFRVNLAIDQSLGKVSGYVGDYSADLAVAVDDAGKGGTITGHAAGNLVSLSQANGILSGRAGDLGDHYNYVGFDAAGPNGLGHAYGNAGNHPVDFWIDAADMGVGWSSATVSGAAAGGETSLRVSCIDGKGFGHARVEGRAGGHPVELRIDFLGELWGKVGGTWVFLRVWPNSSGSPGIRGTIGDWDVNPEILT